MTKTEMRKKVLKRFVDGMESNTTNEDIEIIRMLIDDISMAEYCDRREEEADG